MEVFYLIKPLSFFLSGADQVFNYQLKVENKTADCPVKNSDILCNIESLKLLQDKNYNIELVGLLVSILRELTTWFADTISDSNVSIYPGLQRYFAGNTRAARPHHQHVK